MHIFIITGAGIIALLGLMHAVITVTSRPERGAMTPTDPDVQHAMQLSGGLGLAPEISVPLWRAWIGFNLSHSIGAILLGGIIAIPAIRDVSVALDDPWWVATTLSLPTLLTAISVRYWFAKPTQGLTLATLCIWIGVVGGLL